MKRFKVVVEEDGKLFSIMAKGRFRLEYEPGVPTAIKYEGYGPLTFEKIEDASKWMFHKDSQVWICEADGEMELPDPLVMTTTPWKPAEDIDWPVGTEMWERVTLLEQTVVPED